MEVLRDLSADISSLNDGIQRLQAIRAELYENLNQIQHEYLIIQGIQWLQARGYTGDGVEWYWNPRQTGDSREPDLLAKNNAKIVVSAEATASESPQGVIDTRMRNTLSKLNTMEGDKFYFVRTEAMAKRARTKINKNHWNIEVVKVEF
ncbi:MAG: hypothetical protein AB1700_07310 [Bacillota bacterium]